MRMIVVDFIEKLNTGNNCTLILDFVAYLVSYLITNKCKM